MSQPTTPRRKYNSRRREEQARETKRRILDAALVLFGRHGYTGATMEAIAQEAGVAPLTVYSAFGSKAALLAALVAVSVGGDDQPIPLLQRPEPQAVLRETNPIVQIRRFATNISDILERMAPIVAIMRMAAKTEPDIAIALAALLERRFENLRVFVQALAAHTNLRDGLDVDAATETVWAIAGPDVYLLLTIDRGWSKERFAQWLGDSLTRLLLP